MRRVAIARSVKPLRRSRLKQKFRRHDPTPEGWRSRYGICPLCLTVGVVDAHHLVPARYLRRRGLQAHLWDARNRLWAGRDCCHTAHETRRRPIPRAFLPRAAERFAAEMNCLDVLDRLYGEADAK